MELFKGLFIGEIVLLLLGIVFFLALLVILIFLIIKKRAYKQMIPLFLFPILMIGFPSVAKIKYDKGIFEIELKTSYLQSHPADTSAKKVLVEKIQQTQSRASSDASAQIVIAKANLSIGDTTRARQAVNSALRINPTMVPAHNLSRSINRRSINRH